MNPVQKIHSGQAVDGAVTIEHPTPMPDADRFTLSDLPPLSLEVLRDQPLQ